MPLAMSDLSLCVRVGLAPILVIQLLKVCDLDAETPNLFTKHCKMIHVSRISHPGVPRQSLSLPRRFGNIEARSSP
jgi:hypothetical protein